VIIGNALFPANKLNSECILCFGVSFSNHSSVGAKKKHFFILLFMKESARKCKMHRNVKNNKIAKQYQGSSGLQSRIFFRVFDNEWQKQFSQFKTRNDFPFKKKSFSSIYCQRLKAH
jgi:hypothetical protein